MQSLCQCVTWYDDHLQMDCMHITCMPVVKQPQSFVCSSCYRQPALMLAVGRGGCVSVCGLPVTHRPPVPHHNVPHASCATEAPHSYVGACCAAYNAACWMQLLALLPNIGNGAAVGSNVRYFPVCALWVITVKTVTTCTLPAVT